MFVVTVRFEIHAAHAAAFLARVRVQALDSLREEPACSRFDVCTNPEEPGLVFLYELYDDRAAFDLHLASAHFKAFDAEVSSWVVSKEVGFWALA